MLAVASCTMAAFVYNGREVYNAKDIKEKYPVFFHGCGERIKDVVEKRSIPPDVVTYVIKTSDGWNPSTAHIKKSAVLLDKAWVDENIQLIVKTGIKSSTGKTYLPAPSILELNDEEKFTDDTGNIYEIEVRGERNINLCYFRASDTVVFRN